MLFLPLCSLSNGITQRERRHTFVMILDTIVCEGKSQIMLLFQELLV